MRFCAAGGISLLEEAPNSAQEQTNPRLEAALQYAARGWHVFPAVLGEKKSHKSAEHSDGRPWGATTDADEIRRDWARWPDANVGIVCGRLSGMFVTDVDTPEGHGVDGHATLAELEEGHEALPATLEAESPTGSSHIFHKYPAGLVIPGSIGKVGPGN
jgi:putative DNA primase/helicase